MATKRKITKTIKRKPRKSRAERKSLDDIHYGSEPDVNYFDDPKNTIGSFFNWYNYMWDRKTTVNAYILMHTLVSRKKLKHIRFYH